MRIQTMSIVVGTEACNASCPFCVSKMTVENGVGMKLPEVKWDRLKKALQFAERMGVTTVLLTGKGEPTLFPTQIDAFTRVVGERFPFVELQTNGLWIAESKFSESFLKKWSEFGLTTVALSVVHYRSDLNKEIYLGHRPNKEYPHLTDTIKKIHNAGLSVRLTLMMMKGGIEQPDDVVGMALYARERGVEQLTVRSITAADVTRNLAVNKWIEEHAISREGMLEVRDYLDNHGKLLLTLQHGGLVYDLYGQNVCLTDCLTLPKGEDIRQIIFFPDGHLRYDWQYEGAILM